MVVGSVVVGTVVVVCVVIEIGCTTVVFLFSARTPQKEPAQTTSNATRAITVVFDLDIRFLLAFRKNIQIDIITHNVLSNRIAKKIEKVKYFLKIVIIRNYF